MAMTTALDDMRGGKCAHTIRTRTTHTHTHTHMHTTTHHTHTPHTHTHLPTKESEDMTTLMSWMVASICSFCSSCGNSSSGGQGKAYNQRKDTTHELKQSTTTGLSQAVSMLWWPATRDGRSCRHCTLRPVLPHPTWTQTKDPSYSAPTTGHSTGGAEGRPLQGATMTLNTTRSEEQYWR